MVHTNPIFKIGGTKMLEKIESELCQFRAAVGLASEVLKKYSTDEEIMHHVQLVLSTCEERIYKLIIEIREYQDKKSNK